MENSPESASDTTGDNADESDTAESVTTESGTPEEIYGAETVAEFEARGLARYQRHFENKDEYFEEDKKQNLIDLITLCKERNITPVLITTPYTVYYNQYAVSYTHLDVYKRQGKERSWSVSEENIVMNRSFWQ